MNVQTNQVIITPTKSAGTAIILTVLFGPLGMFYSTIPGGIVMTFISFIATVISILTLGIGLLLFLVIWPIQIIWTAVAVSNYNKNILTGRRAY